MRGCITLGVLIGAGACGRIGFDSSSDAEPLDPSLVAWYAMDDAADDGAHDSSPFADDGTCGSPSCPGSTSGIRAGAFKFDGIDDMLRVPRDPGTIGTIAAWVRLDRAPATGTAAVIAGKAFATDKISWQCYLVGTATGVELRGGGNSVLGNFLVVPYPDPGEWHHVAMTWDGSTVRLYLEGTLASASFLDLDLDAHSVTIATGRETGDTPDFLAGLLDDFRLYSRTLPESEIAALAAR